MGNSMVIVRKPESLELWQERISKCRNSGMTVADWCAKEGLSDKTYYYWHRKLRRLQEAETHSQQCSFYEIHQPNQSKAEISATLHYGGILVDVYTGADEETLLRLCRVLRQCWKVGCRQRFIWPVDLQISEEGSTDWRASYRSSFNWIPLKMRCFCSAAGEQTESKDCIGIPMDFCCCTSGWKAEAFAGRGLHRKQSRSPCSSMSGSVQVLKLKPETSLWTRLGWNSLSQNREFFHMNLKPVSEKVRYVVLETCR